MLGTASWNRTLEPTGIRDQLPAPHGDNRPYGEGLLAQQWLAFGRIVARLTGTDLPARGGLPPRALHPLPLLTSS
jgi:hypothetical protein